MINNATTMAACTVTSCGHSGTRAACSTISNPIHIE
jgi:hypothetical protein